LGRDGRESSGTLTADSRAAALSLIMDRGLHPLSVEERGGNGSARSADGHAKADGAGREGRVSQKAVESFTRELANLLSGGVPLSRALQLLKREASNPAAKFVWGKINDDIVDGMPLADALARWPKAFSTVYVAMVRAGEAGGFLELVLAQIAEFRTREQDLRG